MFKAYIDGSSQSVGKRSALAFTVTDFKGNVEYQHYELLDKKRNCAEIEMMAFNKLMDWLLENKIKKVIVHTESRHVYAHWKNNKIYNLNRNKFNIFNVRLIGNESYTYKFETKNMAYA